MTKTEVEKKIDAVLVEFNADINKILKKHTKKISDLCVKNGYSYHMGLPKDAAKNLVKDFMEYRKWFKDELWSEDKAMKKLRKLCADACAEMNAID